MTCKEYQMAVIELFKDGSPTRSQWEQMAACVSDCSESYHIETNTIDIVCDPKGWEEGMYELDE